MNPNKTRVRRILYIIWFFFTIAGFTVLKSNDCFAAAIDASIDFSYDTGETTTTTSGTSTNESVNNSYMLSYKEKINMALDLQSEFKIDTTKSKASDQYTATTFDPEMTVGVASTQWILDMGVKEGITDSEDPNAKKKTTFDYYFDFELKPEVIIPEMQLKLSQTESYEPETTDTLNASVEFSTDYEIDFMGIGLDFNYNKAITDDRLKRDSDTLDKTYDYSLSLKHDFTNTINYSFDYAADSAHGVTYFDDGEIKSESSSTSYGIKNSLDYSVFEKTQFGVANDYSDSKDTITNITDVSKSSSANVSQDVYDWISLKFDYGKNSTETLDSPNDSWTITDSYTSGATVKPNKFFDLAVDTNQSKSIDNENDITQAKDINASWTNELTESLKLSYDVSNKKAYTDGSLDSDDDSMQFQVDIKIDTEINLKITPSYGYDKERDLILGYDTSKESLDVEVEYTINPTRKMEIKVNHSYSRSENHDTSVIERTDD